MNILTFDIEEWFHLLDNDSTRTENEWKRYPVRIHENVERILRVLDETNTQATFFVIGWIAKNYPEIVRKIASKYEIGSHTMNHQLVWQQDPNTFKKDTESSIKLLQDITGTPVRYFRAPGFSIREQDGWAVEILAELGVTTDASVFPAHHAHGGMPSYTQPVPSIISYNQIHLREFPISVKYLFGKPIIYSGGGYFRLFPYSLIRKWSVEAEYVMTYIHPRDLDPQQPMIEDLPAIRKFKSYVGLRHAERKLRKLLTDFHFVDIQTASQKIDWENVPIVEI